jgi:hypothetical protein
VGAPQTLDAVGCRPLILVVPNRVAVDLTLVDYADR